MFREGSQIGLYTLIRKLGRGGFGEVWLAERRAKFVTTKVAVKLPHDEQVDHEAIKQEATLWEQASGHPNILPIIDADEYGGQIVIVSEYAPDGSLEEWLKTNGAMPVQRAIETTIQILDGLEFLHSRNIIHRDLKPANILLQGTTPRLADFGISRALRTTVASQSQNISGTLAYMSPEALDGRRSIQTDVWSVGVNLYQFLTGTLPFPQKEPSVLFPAIIMREFAPLPDSIPQNLQNVIAKALAKLPENRYKTSGEMREDLKKILVNVSFPQFAPTEVLPKASLLETITAPVTIENETVVRKANIPEKLAEVQHQRESKKKRRAELKRKQSEAEILQQDELERQRWQAAEVKRKEEIKRREAERKEEKKRRNQEHSKWVRRQKTEEEQKTLEEMIGREAKRQKEIRRFVKVELKEKEPNVTKKMAIGISIGALALIILGGLIWAVSSNSPSNVATNKAVNTASMSLSNTFKNSIGMEFVKIPTGTFMMGSGDAERREAFRVAKLMSWDASLDWFKDEGPIRKVTIGYEFYLGKYEVTQEEYEKVVGTNSSKFEGCPKCPVENVSWNDAKDFIKKLNAKNDGYEYRLPSEAEWEYAARGGKQGQAFGIRDGKNLSSEQANFKGDYPYGNAPKGKYLQKTTPVGSYQPNAFGLYDMHGNLNESGQIVIFRFPQTDLVVGKTRPALLLAPLPSGYNDWLVCIISSLNATDDFRN